ALAGQGTAAASQAAWAVLGLLAAGEAHGSAVRSGIDHLLGTQQADGSWYEEQFTGTGFPKVFYLKYHMYALYFPLMALARYAAASSPRHTANGQSRKATPLHENGKGDRHAFSSESHDVDGGLYRAEETLRGE